MLAALAIGASTAWAYALLDRTPTWQPWLRSVVVIAGGLSILGLLLAPRLARLQQRAMVGAAVLGAAASIAAPVAYAADTVATAHTGSLIAAGPAGSSGAGEGPGGMGGPGAGSGMPPQGAIPGSSGPPAGLPVGQPGGFGRRGPDVTTRVSPALVKVLRNQASRYRWVAATSGSQNAATLELATGEPVMAIGGFSNQGGNLSLAEFEKHVAAGDIHYYIAGGAGGAPGRGGTTDQITSWVEAHFKSQTVGQQVVYDLTAGR